MTGRDALDVDPGELAALASRLSRIGAELGGMRDELAALLGEADAAVGDGAAADAFRRGFAPAATAGLDRIAAAGAGLDRHIAFVRHGAATVADTDHALAHQDSPHGPAPGRADDD